MSIEKKIHIVYAGGMFGNLFRWLLDRFSPDCQFKHIFDPWDKNNRVHERGEERKKYNTKFTSRCVRLQSLYGGGFSADTSADNIVINFSLDDWLFAERCAFYRNPGYENEEDRYKTTISHASDTLLKLFNIDNTACSKTVSKELYKIQFHDDKNQIWWNDMIKLLLNTTHYQFPVESLWNKDLFIQQIKNISDRFVLNLKIDETIIDNVTKKIHEMYVIKTKNRAKEVLQAIENKKNIDCSELDIVEQAWIETILEKQKDSVIFPYGCNWFKNTDQINEFLDTYPSYLKHMNPRLPWYNGIKNPFYLSGKIDEPK